MAIKNEVVDELLKGVDLKQVVTSDGLLAEIKKALAERMLNAELDQHLDDEAAAAAAGGERAGAPTSFGPPRTFGGTVSYSFR